MAKPRTTIKKPLRTIANDDLASVNGGMGWVDVAMIAGPSILGTLAVVKFWPRKS